MQKPRPFWFLLDFYAWVVFFMGLVSAFIIKQPWVVLVGLVGYLLTLIVDITGGRALGRTGAIRLAQAEQENRELRAEQARLLGEIQEHHENLNKISPVSQPPIDEQTKSN